MHVDDDAVLAFVDGALPAPEQSQIRAHLDTCPVCRDLVLHAAKQRPARPHSETELAIGSNRTDAPRDSLREGAPLGPYVIERLLGAGGMGVVYLARDPRLDRKVAIKLLRRGHEAHAAELAERLRRESQALARLIHPNVTVVYELGSARDDIYIAMEYVAGSTLRAWLTGAPRTPAEVLGMFVQAGRGLAAAHAAGLVHRDFKPDNVLLGADGTAKVTDFGLARIADGMLEPPGDGYASADDTLTVTGTIMGTPAYMAPEQFAGRTIDARADQFAFCIALHEGLYGMRPFRGASIAELRDAVAAGKVELPRTPRVPGRVRRALLRGLSPAPEDRFPSMDALLAAMTPRRRRTAAVVAGVSAAAAAALAVTAFARHASPAPCAGAAAEVEAVWGPARREAVHQAFLATRAAGAAETWSAVERGVDSYLAAWSAMHVQACEATRVHAQQSQAVLDLRMGCLERRRAELDALLGVLAQADAEVVHHARDAVAQLPELAPCADVGGLAHRSDVPTDPEARGRYDDLRRRLDQARARVEVARYREAEPLLTTLVGDPGIAAFPALEAEAQQTRGKLLTVQGALADAEQALFRAYARAQAARADDLIAHAAVDLAHVVGFDAGRAAEGRRWVELATAAIAAKGGDDLLSARLETVRAGILEREGKLPEAEAADRRALDVASRKAPGSPLEAEALDALGMVLALEGNLDEARGLFEKCIAMSERILGDTHSLTASRRMNLANALTGLRRYDEARAQYEHALGTEEALFGRDGLEVARVLSNLGQMLQEQGKLADARPVLERALAIREKALGADDPAVARTLANLAYLMLDEKAYQDALDRFARVGTILDHRLGPDNPARADDLTGTGLAYLGLGRPADAIAPLSRAAALAEQSGSDPVNLASIQGRLAQALHASGRDRARAIRLATAARKVLADAGETAEVANLDAWLGKHE